ncbi:methyltransferase [Cordyceps militaris]|uniref:Methyltransferase n=1 Tax=Cordyceps militaris TaxID=73501 RepID=A0A2H4SP51_CORMI|nr:methyltransferase [Cordyceps militaris]
MAEQGKDDWNSGDYQHSASFVPKLAGKVTQWLDLQKDDVVLDIGCGDGILNLEFSKVLSEGKGSIHGIDSSAAMIVAARDLCKEHPNATFKGMATTPTWTSPKNQTSYTNHSSAVLDGTKIHSNAALQNASFSKVFSNAAMHWILRAPATRASFFAAVHAALAPGGVFVFEMGGLGNVQEMAAALLVACARRCPGGLAAVTERHYPWFFPDEAWVTAALEAAGFRADRVEREWRPTRADEGGVEGWLRLFGKAILESVPEGAEREAAVREAAEALRFVCDDGHGGQMISYVRLRALATKV